MNNKQVVTIITQERAYKSGSFLLKMAKNTDCIIRNTAYITPKKIFRTAVIRNRAKRLLKAALLSSGCFTNKGFLYVFTLNSSILKSTNSDLVDEIKFFASKNGIL